MESTKDKIDKKLGISSGQSIDSYLDDLSIDINSKESIENAFNQITDDVKDAVENLDTNLSAIQSKTTSFDELKNIEKNFEDINSLISTTKSLIKHIYDNVISSELIDSELVNSVGSMIEIAHSNIKEYLEIYKEKLKFYNRVKLEMLRFENQKNLMQFKYELSQKASRSEGAIEAEEANMQSYRQEDIVKFLSDEDPETVS